MAGPSNAPNALQAVPPTASPLQPAAAGAVTLPRAPIVRVSLEEVRDWTDNFSAVLGSGTYGDVVSGFSLAFGPVAVKRMKTSVLADVTLRQDRDAALQALRNEQGVMERVSVHPNVASLLAYAGEGDQLALVYELAGGGSLHSELHSPPPNDGVERRMCWQQRLKVLEGAACGLRHLHACGVYHRDISSSNIGLGPGGAAKLLDCGLAVVAPLPEGITAVSCCSLYV